MAAPRVSESAAVQRHYAAQFALMEAIVAFLRRLWPALDPMDLPGSWPNVRRGVASLTEQYAEASMSLALDYYTELRRASGVPGSFTPHMPGPIPAGAVEAYLDEATKGLLVTPDLVDEVFLAQFTADLEAEVAAAVQSLEADAGRNALLTAVAQDKQARGWARVTRPGACYFCRMLAARGAVYKSKETANFRAHTKFNGKGGVCRCTVEPLFGAAYEPPAHTRADQALWDRVAEGKSPAEARNEFRRHVEGRADGPRRELKTQREDRKRREKRPTVKGQQLGFDNLTPDQLRHNLAVVEALPDSDYRTRQIKRIRDRLAELGD